MKRMLSLSLSALLLLALTLTCLAAEPSFVQIDATLREDERTALEALRSAVRRDFGIEAFFVINNDYAGGEAFKVYAQDYLHTHAEGDDALIFAVSSETYYLNTTGKAGTLLEESDMHTLYEAIREADENGDQPRAALQFYSTLLQLLNKRKAEPALSVSGPDVTTAPATAEPDKADTRVVIPGSVPIPNQISPVRGDRLVDQADLLTPEAETALQEKLDEISEKHQFDVVIVTAAQIGSRSAMEFADDYFDYNGFGFGESFDGVCLLISMAERDWWISTSGFGETALSDDYFLSFISLSDFMKHLKSGDYDQSFQYFADVVDDFVAEAKKGTPYSAKHRYQDWKNKVIGVGISLGIGLIAAGFVTYSKKQTYVGAVQEKREAGIYMVGSVRFGNCYDNLISTYVNRTRRQQDSGSESSSSGRSYTSAGHHTSSSGRSHGGGGGKF